MASLAVTAPAPAVLVVIVLADLAITSATTNVLHLVHVTAIVLCA